MQAASLIEKAMQSAGRFSIGIEAGLHGCYALRFSSFHFLSAFHPHPTSTIEQKCGALAFLASDLTGALLWFSRIGHLYGKKILQLLPLSPLTVVLRGVSYAFYGVHACKELKKDIRNRQAWFDLAASVAQVALAVFVIFAAKYAAVILGFTALAYSLTAVSIGHFLIDYLIKERKRRRENEGA
jgi:cation transport ATPase